MKKALVLTLIMVLAVAGVASAEAKLGGEFKVEYVIDTDKKDAGKGDASSVPLTLTVTAEEEGVWSVEADLEADASGGEVALGDWSMNLTDDLFVADLWGGEVEKDGVSTPLEFIDTGDDVTAEDAVARLRLNSDILGYADVTLDYHPDELFVFASKALDEVTVGAAIQKENLHKEGVKGAAHVEYVYGPATLTGEVGLDNTEGKDKDNTFIGGKVAYKLNDQITLKGKVTHHAANLDDKLVIEGGADYVESLWKVSGTVTRSEYDFSDKDRKNASTNKLKAGVTYRSNEDVGFDDLFDDYDTLTGYAAFAEAAYTTAKDDGVDTKPTTELTLKGAASAVPDMVWAYGEFNYKSDEDKFDEDFKFIDESTPDKKKTKETLKVKDYFKVKAEGTVQLTEKVKVIPAVKYGKWTKVDVGAVENDLSELDLSTALTYALSDSSEIGVSYTNRTQKYAEEPVLELNDSFAKVYFKTSF